MNRARTYFRILAVVAMVTLFNSIPLRPVTTLDPFVDPFRCWNFREMQQPAGTVMQTVGAGFVPLCAPQNRSQ